MGSIYKRAAELERQVALKVLSLDFGGTALS